MPEFQVNLEFVVSGFPACELGKRIIENCFISGAIGIVLNQEMMPSSSQAC